MRRSGVRAVFFLACLLASPGLAATAEEELWQSLQRGGHVILVRHTSTEPGVGDPPGYRLDNCATQRNLSAAGREEARSIGEAFRAHGVPVGEVRASQWCRCLETARLAFGAAVPWPPLNSFFDARSREPEQTRAVRALIGRPFADTNLVLVTHQVNIVALTGRSAAPGELVVVRAGDAKSRPVGRLRPTAGTAMKGDQ
jgi:phosphohistidine phosphatase SixA